jgi:hypothetical protein
MVRPLSPPIHHPVTTQIGHFIAMSLFHRMRFTVSPSLHLLDL